MTEIILKELLEKHRHPKWLCLFELRIGTGYGLGREKRIDLFCINCYPSENLLRIVYEIKVSRSDFLSELRKPYKRREAMMFSNQFYFVSLNNFCRVDEIPLGCGLIEFQEGKLKEIIPAPLRESARPTWGLFASAIRQQMRGK